MDCKMISKLLCILADLSCDKGICKSRDKIYAINRAMYVCGVSNLECSGIDDKSDIQSNTSIHEIVEQILDWAFEYNLFPENNDTYRDLFTGKLMDCFTMSPSEVEHQFKILYDENYVKATDFFYEFSKATQYVRMDRVAKNKKWSSDTKYGQIDITINLSKPEKDPKIIAELANIKSGKYPECLLCKENEGYAGGIHHPARQNHRTIELDLLGETWYMQYSPYVYYNEHCIVFKNSHSPMKITNQTFKRLFEFVKIFPHYFIGSNADLPIVGGSILSHDHFQGGRYSFAMDRAKVIDEFAMKDFDGVKIQSLYWPLSVIRLKGENISKLAEAANLIFEQWKSYEDLERGIVPFSIGEDGTKVRHNTVTPIARKVGCEYEMDIVLRNNRTDKENPLGIFHPHSDVHNIKKENIGLIEVLGLAVLPARLKDEMSILAEYWFGNYNGELNDYPKIIDNHINWFKKFSDLYNPNSIDDAYDYIESEISNTFIEVLEYSGVFKQTKFGQTGMEKFLSAYK